MSRRKRRAHEEEHENHERWLVTYADMVTLLMVLFIVMFAMSQVDEKKFNALKEGLAAGFGQSTSILDGSSSILDQPGIAAQRAGAPRNRFAVGPAAEVQTAASASGRSPSPPRRTRAARQYRRRRRPRSTGSTALRSGCMSALREHGLEARRRGHLRRARPGVSLVSRHIVFDADLAELTPRGRRVVDALAPVLRDLTDPLEIDGHTNQVKVKPKYYATDWDLSAARAVTRPAPPQRVRRRPDRPADRLPPSGTTKPLVDPQQARLASRSTSASTSSC